MLSNQKKSLLSVIFIPPAICVFLPLGNNFICLTNSFSLLFKTIVLVSFHIILRKTSVKTLSSTLFLKILRLYLTPPSVFWDILVTISSTSSSISFFNSFWASHFLYISFLISFVTVLYFLILLRKYFSSLLVESYRHWILFCFA